MFEYTLREPNRTLFKDMISQVRTKEYEAAFASAPKVESSFILIMALIFEQQKMIKRLIKELTN